MGFYFISKAYPIVRGRIFAVTSTAHFINDGSTVIFSAVYPLFVSFGLSYIDVALASTVFQALNSLFGLFVGWLSDRVGRPMMLMGLGLVMWPASILLLHASMTNHSYVLLLLSAAVGGIASSFYHPLVSVVISDYFPDKKGAAMGISESFGSLGRAVYPTITISLVTGFALGIVPLALIAAFVSLVMVIITREKPVGASRSRKARELDRRSTNIFGILLIIIPILVSMLMRGTIAQGVINFLPIYLTKEVGLPYDVRVGLVTTVMLLGSTIAAPVLGTLSDRVGRVNVLVINAIISMVTLLTFTWLGYHEYLIYVLLFIYGFFSAGGLTLYLSYVTDVVPRHYAGIASAILWGFGLRGGAVLGPLLVGVLATWMSIRGAFEVLALLNLVSVAALLITRGRVG